MARSTTSSVARCPSANSKLGAKIAVASTVGRLASGSTAPIFTSASSAARAIDKPAPSAHHASAGHQGGYLIAGEHQRRQIIAIAHDIADASLAFDRHAGPLKIDDIAIDRALGHFQFVSKHARGDKPATAQKLNDLKEAISPSHGVPVVCISCR
jgi:hypothetical protein